MKLDKLAKQLRRDLAANPKKAIALGVMALVALYFWAPLVWQWLAPAGGKSASQSATALILTDDPEEPAQAAKRRAAARFRWEKVRQLIEQDRLMKPAILAQHWSDPFAAVNQPPPDKTTEATAAGSATSATRLAMDLGPEEAGVVLEGVVIGRQQRSATINGDTYPEGRAIKLAKEGALAAVEFRLTRITPRGVELERNGKKYILLLPAARLATGDVITPAGLKRSD